MRQAASDEACGANSKAPDATGKLYQKNLI